MPKQVDKEKRCSEIAIQAISLFARQGLDKTTIQNIADYVGIGKGTVYEYFPNKEALITQAGIEVFQKMENDLGSDFREIESPLDKLKTLIETMIEATFDMEDLMIVYMEVWQLSLREGRFEEIMQILKQGLEEYRKLVYTIIQEGKRKSLFQKNINAKALSFSLIAALDGIGMHLLMDKPKAKPKEIAKEFVRTFLNGILLK